MINRNLLSLDFYGEGITAALACLDEKTDTLRIRHIVRQPCKSFSGGLVRDRNGAQEELTRVFEKIGEFSSDPLVVVGIRGSFLSFQPRTGFSYPQARTQIIRDEDIDEAIHNSLPPNLDDSYLEVVDVLPQSFSIDGQHGIIDPKGISGCCLEAETFISLGVASHLANLKSVLAACGCEDFLWMPTSIALGETALTPSEQGASCLLVDIGDNSLSAVLYYKDSLVAGWEIPFGLDRVAEGVADQLQNDLSAAWQILRTYEPDPVTDEVLEEAARPLAEAFHKELVQSLTYIQHPPAHLVLCGQGAWPVLLKLFKDTLGVRRARLCAFNKLISDCEIDLPQYDGALSLLQHALVREKQQLGVAQIKEGGLLGKLFTKLGFNLF